MPITKSWIGSAVILVIIYSGAVRDTGIKSFPEIGKMNFGELDIAGAEELGEAAVEAHQALIHHLLVQVIAGVEGREVALLILNATLAKTHDPEGKTWLAEAMEYIRTKYGIQQR